MFSKIIYFLFFCWGSMNYLGCAANLDKAQDIHLQEASSLRAEIFTCQRIASREDLQIKFAKYSDVINRIPYKPDNISEEREEAVEMLTQLAQKGFTPALDFGLNRITEDNKKAVYLLTN